MDTDVLVLKNLDCVLKNRAFIGYETMDLPLTAVFGAEANHPFIKKILKEYDEREISFTPKDANPILFKKILINNYSFKFGNIEQVLKDDIHVYKKNTFCDPSLKSKTIHIFSGSWLDGKQRWINDLDRKFRAHLTNSFIILLYIPFKRVIKIVKWFGRMGKKLISSNK